MANIKRRNLSERTSVTVRNHDQVVSIAPKAIPEGYNPRAYSINEVTKLVRSVFVRHVPRGYARRRDFVSAIMPTILRMPSDKIEGLLLDLKYAYNSTSDYANAEKSLLRLKFNA